MKIYMITHTDGTVSYGSGPTMVKKPDDTPVVTEIDVLDTDGQQFMDNPTAYTITNGEIVKL